MRSALAIAVTATVMGACKPNCGPLNQLDGRTYALFGNVITWETGATGAPPGMTPVNGRTDWSFQWGATPQGPVSITIDDQEFEGEGIWYPSECGNFTVAFGGTFESSDGSTHNFSTAGNFLFYDTQLEGAMAWNETWSSQGEIGTLDASDASVSGQFTSDR